MAATGGGGDLEARIREQVEYYFSDSNFRRDKFLRGKADEDPQGCTSSRAPPRPSRRAAPGLGGSRTPRFPPGTARAASVRAEWRDVRGVQAAGWPRAGVGSAPAPNRWSRARTFPTRVRRVPLVAQSWTWRCC